MLRLAAQTLDEVVRQFVTGLENGYGVAVDNRFQYFPVMWMAKGARSVENIILEDRIKLRSFITTAGRHRQGADPLFPLYSGELEEQPA